MKKPDCVNIPAEFIRSYLPILKPSYAVHVYLVVMAATTGRREDTVARLKMSEICDLTGVGEATVKKCLAELVEKKLLNVIVNTSGEKTGNEYSIRYDHDGVQKIPPVEDGVQSLTGVKVYRGSNYGTCHGFKNPISSTNPPCEETPAALPSASPRQKKVNKKSPDEHRVFKTLWASFEKQFGHPFTNGTSTVQAKAIWELIERAQGEARFQTARGIEGVNWEEYLERVVRKFFEICETMPKGAELIYSQPVIPSSLNSSGIWPRVAVMVPVKKVSSQLTEAQLERLVRVGR